MLVSDGWKPYWTLDGFEHALCLSHLLRDLASVAESRRHQPWADRMADLLIEAKNTLADAIIAGKPGLFARQLKALRARYQAILADGDALVPARHQPGSATAKPTTSSHGSPNKPTRSPATGRTSPWTRQITKPNATSEWSNQRKISGCFRTLQGAKDYCAIRSYLQTATKHGKQRLDVLVSLFNGQPWIPASP